MYVLTSVCGYPSRSQRERLYAFWSQVGGKLGDDKVHASFGSSIPQDRGDASDAIEFDVATRAGDEYDLLFFPVTNETQETVDDIDVAGQVCLDLFPVSLLS